MTGEDRNAVSETKIALIELDPERLALEMLEPAMPQEAVPVLADPGSDRRLAQVAPGFLALDPLEPLGFLFAALVQTQTGSRSRSRDRPLGYTQPSRPPS